MISSPDNSDRRRFIFQSSLLAAGSVLTPRLISQTKSSKIVIPSHDAARKFNPNGTPKTFKGNTVICHLPAQCVLRDEMISIHEELLHSPYFHKLGATTTDSYHMTVFPGANDQDRDISGWPSYVPIDASIEECNRLVGERIANASISCSLPLRVRLDVEATLARQLASGLTLSAVDAAEERKLSRLRDQISEIYGFRTNDHGSYRFHMTMAYQVAPMTVPEWRSYQQMFSRHVNHIAQALPDIEIGVPEYCTFRNMCRFDPTIYSAALNSFE